MTRIAPRRTSRAVIGSLLVLTVLAAWPAGAKKPSAPEDLFNPFIGVDYSYWLVGAIAELASEAEITEYLGLQSDHAAQLFIDRFWSERNKRTEAFKKTPQQLFEQRSFEADKRFSERTYPGRRTDRGKIFVLFGEPQKIEFESPKEVGTPTLEVWSYKKYEGVSLTGNKPEKQYRFVEIEGQTVFYRNQQLRPDQRQRLGG